ncbi:hypothetical protein ACQKP7_15930 [Pseudomonas frederiksbergensis]|uniref:hypothetical protein n=1 Tax=Pseudomonas frederiksbergensis TaxID=104087 RepID=UPI003D08ACA1
MKTITDEISKKQIYTMILAPNITFWFVVFCIIMSVAWYFSGSALIGIGLGFAIPAFLIKKTVDKRIAMINGVLNNVYAKTMSSLNNVDYYYYHANGSIAVDARKGMISYLKVLPTMEIVSPVIFKTSDIIEYYFYDPGMTTTKYYGRDLAIAQETLTDNLKAIAERVEERGLHMKINDVQNPKIVMSMKEKDSDHWTLILRKLIDGSLEPTNSPILIP